MAEHKSKSVKKPAKQKRSFFKRLVRIIFVESWGMKALALVFAVAVWILFKIV